MLSFLVGLICGASIALPIYAVLVRGTREVPTPRGPRLPHHRRNVVDMRKLPEWQEWQRDVDHLEAVSKRTRDEEAFWIGGRK